MTGSDGRPDKQEKIFMDERFLISEIMELVNSGTAFTDIHIEQDSPVMVRGPGGWVETDKIEPATRDDLAGLLEKIDLDWADNIKIRSINRPYNLSNWRLRVNVFLAAGGSKIAMSIRKMPLRPMTLEDTGLPASVRLMVEQPRGIILVGGATGSGKSTTMAAMIDMVNATRNAHIVTIEDPIEYVHERKKSILSQREVGVDVVSYYDGIKDAMRQRPDVIMIAEVRDKDSADTALLAAESGHLVLASLHANNAVGTIQKLLSFFPRDERESKVAALSNSLVGVLSQILLPTADKTGFALAAELLFNNNGQISKFVGDTDKLNAAIERREDKISRSMSDALVDLVSKGVVSKSDAIKMSADSAVMYERLKAFA